MKDMIITGEIKEVGAGVVSLSNADNKGNRTLTLDYLKIGQHRLRNVQLTSYVMNFIRIGENITISGVQTKNEFIIAAIKMEDGEIIKADILSAFSKLIYISKVMIGALVLSAIAGTFLASLINDNSIPLIVVITLPLWYLLSYYGGFKPLRLRNKAENAISNA